jgi:hypothetical protein
MVTDNNDLLSPQGLETLYSVNEILCQRFYELVVGEWPEDVLLNAVGITEILLFHFGPLMTDEEEAEMLAG